MEPWRQAVKINDRWQQQGNENGDDGDHHQQLDQRESSFRTRHDRLLTVANRLPRPAAFASPGWHRNIKYSYEFKNDDGSASGCQAPRAFGLMRLKRAPQADAAKQALCV